MTRPNHEELGKAIRHYYRKRALALVAAAIKYGEIQRPETFPCAYCGGPSLIYEHRDYHRPLDVVPACDRCNHLQQPAIVDPVTVIDNLAGRSTFPFRRRNSGD